jgi:hypothetical protein
MEIEKIKEIQKTKRKNEPRGKASEIALLFKGNAVRFGGKKKVAFVSS